MDLKWLLWAIFKGIVTAPLKLKNFKFLETWSLIVDHKAVSLRTSSTLFCFCFCSGMEEACNLCAYVKYKQTATPLLMYKTSLASSYNEFETFCHHLLSSWIIPWLLQKVCQLWSAFWERLKKKVLYPTKDKLISEMKAGGISLADSRRAVERHVKEHIDDDMKIANGY